MKQAEPNNSLWNSVGSVLVNAAAPEFHRGLAAVGLLGMAIDLLVFQALFALGANVAASQIASFFAGVIVILVRNARRAFAQPEPTGDVIRRIFNGRLLVVCISTLLFRSAVLVLLIESWHWLPQTSIMSCESKRSVRAMGLFSIITMRQ